MRAALIASFLLAAVAFGQTEEKASTPYVIVTKTVSAGEVVIGTPVTVTVVASNIGTQTAYNVNLIDTHPLGNAAPSKSADRLAYGDNITVSYTFTPSELGAATLAPAECTYSQEDGDEATTIKSVSNYVREELDLYLSNVEAPTVRGTIMVLTQDQYDRIHSKKIFEMISYAILAAIPVVVPYLLFKSKLAQVDALVRESKKKI